MVLHCSPKFLSGLALQSSNGLDNPLWAISLPKSVCYFPARVSWDHVPDKLLNLTSSAQDLGET